MFCVWMSRPGQQGAPFQMDDFLHNQSETSLGEVRKREKIFGTVFFFLECPKLLKKKVNFWNFFERVLSFLQRIGEASHVEALRSTMDLEQSRACDGQFEEEYQPLEAVGKGAFGFVWKAIRRCDGQEVRKKKFF